MMNRRISSLRYIVLALCLTPIVLVGASCSKKTQHEQQLKTASGVLTIQNPTATPLNFPTLILGSPQKAKTRTNDIREQWILHSEIKLAPESGAQVKRAQISGIPDLKNDLYAVAAYKLSAECELPKEAYVVTFDNDSPLGFSTNDANLQGIGFEILESDGKVRFKCYTYYFIVRYSIDGTIKNVTIPEKLPEIPVKVYYQTK